MSRRFRSRHFKAIADPNAKPATPLVLDDSNSHRPFGQPDMRHPNECEGRQYVVAGSSTPLRRAPPASVEPTDAD